MRMAAVDHCGKYRRAPVIGRNIVLRRCWEHPVNPGRSKSAGTPVESILLLLTIAEKNIFLRTDILIKGFFIRKIGKLPLPGEMIFLCIRFNNMNKF